MQDLRTYLLHYYSRQAFLLVRMTRHACRAGRKNNAIRAPPPQNLLLRGFASADKLSLSRAGRAGRTIWNAAIWTLRSRRDSISYALGISSPSLNQNQTDRRRDAYRLRITRACASPLPTLPSTTTISFFTSSTAPCRRTRCATSPARCSGAAARASAAPHRDVLRTANDLNGRLSHADSLGRLALYTPWTSSRAFKHGMPFTGAYTRTARAVHAPLLFSGQ